MVESSMAEEENEIGLPPRFTPQWPPAPVIKPAVRNVPGCSNIFRKSSWPPPTDDNVIITDDESASSGGGQGGALNRPQTNSTDQKSNSNSVVKPPKAVRDYSSFFGKNQKPLIIPVRPKSVQPDAIALPEAFTANPDAEESANE